MYCLWFFKWETGVIATQSAAHCKLFFAKHNLQNEMLHKPTLHDTVMQKYYDLKTHNKFGHFSQISIVKRFSLLSNTGKILTTNSTKP